MKRALLLLLVALLLAAGLFLASQVETQQGYFSPVFSPDGAEVFFLVRESRGLVLGLGFEFWSPPAHVFVWKDRFSLRKIHLESGRIETLKTWPPSPLEGRRIRTYRGRIFSTISTQLRWVDAVHLEYKITVRVPRQPSAERYFVSRLWNNVRSELVEQDRWTQDWVSVTGYDGSPVAGGRELIAAHGEQTYPCSVVIYQPASATVEVVLETPVCGRLYPAGISPSDVAPLSKKKEVDRLQELETTRESLHQQARAEGLSEHEAALEVIRRMQDLGYYPRPPQLIARALSQTETDSLRRTEALEPLFAISEMEFQVGMFQDILRALDAPGTEVEKSMGQYVIHRDFTTSARLNDFLNSEGSLFYVERAGRTYELKLKKP